MMIALTALAVWVVGAVVAYRFDHDRAGTGCGRLIEAAAWPALLIIVLFLLIAAGLGLLFRAFRPKG